MPNYANSKIYAIRSNQTDKIYIGSTVQPLSVRMAQHRAEHKNGRTDACSSTEIMQYADAYIELIEEIKCENKDQLRKREGEIIRNTANCVNKCIAGRTKADWTQENKEHVAAYKHFWYEANKAARHSQKVQNTLQEATQPQ